MRADCLNLVQKTGKVEEPREYIPVGLTSNHTQWDSQWFYLQNNDDLFPDYTEHLISERPDNWNYGVVKTLQSRLYPILDATFDLSTVHHRQVLSLMSRPLRMDEMGPGVSSRDLEACRMSNEAPADEGVAARVRSAIAGDFQPEHINVFPMKPDEGSIDLVSSSPCHYSIFDLSDSSWDSPQLAQGPIDTWSSKPLVKEDGIDHERRRESAEKQKSAKDLEKRKEKKKNLERQALEKRRAKSRKK